MGDPAAPWPISTPSSTPRSAASATALLAEARVRGDRIVVNDIPLLFESADPAEFDLVVLVDAPRGAPPRRLIAARGLPRRGATA